MTYYVEICALIRMLFLITVQNTVDNVNNFSDSLVISGIYVKSYII